MVSVLDYLADGIKEGQKLTKREIQYLQYTVLGFTDKEIASVLEISPRTVQSFMTKIQIKLGSKNRTHSAAIYICKKLGVSLKDVFEG